jgi:pyruvate dehydrogenase E1 component alpha subunit
VHRARAGDGPSLIEARTWRWRGHWAGDEQRYRVAADPAGVEDPLDLHAYRLLESGAASAADLDAIHRQVDADVSAAMARAAAAPDAGADELGPEDVYA